MDKDTAPECAAMDVLSECEEAMCAIQAMADRHDIVKQKCIDNNEPFPAVTRADNLRWLQLREKLQLLEKLMMTKIMHQGDEVVEKRKEGLLEFLASLEKRILIIMQTNEKLLKRQTSSSADNALDALLKKMESSNISVSKNNNNQNNNQNNNIIEKETKQILPDSAIAIPIPVADPMQEPIPVKKERPMSKSQKKKAKKKKAAAAAAAAALLENKNNNNINNNINNNDDNNNNDNQDNNQNNNDNICIHKKNELQSSVRSSQRVLTQRDPELELGEVFTWDTKQVIKWVNESDFKQYSSKFKELNIDGEALLLIDETDLIKSFEIDNIYHRRAIIYSLSKLTY